MMRGRLASLMILALCAAGAAPLARADRKVAWTRAGDADLERDLNRLAAQGLRLAAISDGLPCAVAAMQAPERPAPPAVYRVVPERDLASALEGLVDEGFVPRASARMAGTRHQVVFERTAGQRAPGDWRLIEFEKLEDLDAALAAAAVEGFRVTLAVRAPFRSWPGLSEKGLVLAMKPPSGAARQSRVLIGTNRDLKDVTGPLKSATAEGWSLDGLLTSARDGSRDARRERVVLVLSRDGGAAASGRAVTIERQTSFGIFGSGTLAGAGLFWNDYLTAWTPAERRQIWASPIRLSKLEAGCAGLELKLRLDGMADQAWDIVALLAKPRTTDGYELVVITEQRLGGG